MVENEVAVIFTRHKSEFDLVEEFVPVKIVEGYYDEYEMVFIDAEQNVYQHIASPATIGNVYASRKSIVKLIKMNEKLPLKDLKAKYLNEHKKYEYFKNNEESSNEYGIIKARKFKENNHIIFKDIDTDTYYEMYQEINRHRSNDNAITKQKLADKLEENTNEVKAENKLRPVDIIERTKATIKGQDEALESLVTLIWMKYQFPNNIKNNMLIIGPTGVGKTAIFKKLKKIMNVPISIYTITGVTQSGYKGHDVEEMLEQLYYDSGGDINRTENGIIVIDEFDKIADTRDSGEIGTIAIQNELLKIIEGCEKIITIDHKSIKIDTSNIIFVCCGAFTNLYEKDNKKVIGFENSKETVSKKNTIDTDKLIEYGLTRELVGRLPIIIELNDINNDKEILKDILLNSDESQLKYILESLASIDIEVENLDEVINNMIEESIKRKVGARGLISSTIKTFLRIFYEVGNNPDKYSKIIIGKNILNDKHDFVLVPRKIKRKVKTEN